MPLNDRFHTHSSIIQTSNAINISGTHQESAPLHDHPVNVPHMSVANQVLQQHFNPLPADARRNDRNTKSPRLDIHETRTENTGRHHARNDEEEAARAPQGRRGGQKEK